MSTRDVTIAMTDGVTLAATLYLPETARPQPCLLEALPYRKDDVTRSYEAEYVRLRDEFGYAVCRVDLRGTGSSTGIATDEYPAAEQADLVEVIAWLAGQSWCDGNVGMYGTSYSGFNSIQVAMHRPPALRAIVPIYATDDRYTDDVHYMGGVRRLLDIVDYPTYMVAMNALPPVPEVFGEGWRDEWRRRLDDTPPWLLRWTQERQDGPYWRHGSLRPDYGAVRTPTMIVAGWADGYRDNTFRTYAALTANGTPTRLLIGPWSHQGADTARPGPHVDLCREMARWFDRWLRGADTGIGASTDTDAAGAGAGAGAEPSIVYFARSSTPPAPDTALHRGEWRAESRWPSPRFAEREVRLGGGVRGHVPLASTGTAAWNSCAGALPWGQPTDQRYDDAASLVWEWPADGLEILGHPVLDATVGFDTAEAALSAKLCDVAPDGTSTLVTRGLTRLDRPGEVSLDLEATSWTFAPGHRARLSLTGMDWPNTLAAPVPFTMTLDGDAAALRLPVAVSPPTPAPPTLHTIDPPAAASDPTGIGWRIVDDVLARVTSAEVDHGSTYPIRGGQCSDHYTGRVAIDRRTWRQRAESTAAYRLKWGDLEVSAEAEVVFTADEREVTLEIGLVAREGDATVAERIWRATHARSVG